MSTGFSLLLIATGAVLAFAVNYEVQGMNIETIGVILMVVGIIGLVFSMLFLASFAPFGSHDRVSRERVVEEVPGPRTHDHV